MAYLSINKGNLNKEAIKTYLEMLIYFKENIARQSEAIKRLEEDDKKLCIPEGIEPIRCRKYTKADKKRDIASQVNFYRNMYRTDVWVILIFGMLLITSLLLAAIYHLMVIKIVAVVFSIIIFVGVAKGFKDRGVMEDYMNGRFDKPYDMKIYEYQQAVHEYNAKKRNEDKRMAQEKKKREFLHKQIEILMKMRESSESNLHKALSVGIIHPKYTDWKYIFKMYDYFDTGRCVTLGTGVNGMGAYNMLELENYGKKFMDAASKIIGKIDSIERSQTFLYDSISSMESVLGNISNKLDELAESSPLMNYQVDFDQQTGRYISGICS
jgi:hypothetical protein